MLQELIYSATIIDCDTLYCYFVKQSHRQQNRHDMKLLPAMLMLTLFLNAIGQQEESGAATQYDPPACLSSQEDQKLMMDQLGISALRPGRSPDANAPNAANYDESLANPFPVLPDLLTTDHGKKVTSPEMWYQVRRPEIAEVMEREVYGRVPGNVPEVNWEVVISDK